MQLVRPYQVLGDLLDVAVFVGRNEFGTNRRVHDIEQGFAGRFVGEVFRNPFHEMLDQRFRNRGVQAIHTHVVAVVSSPAERELAKVARTHHKAVHLPGGVHKDLGALACLRVFVGKVVLFGIVAKVLEMLRHGIGDTDFANGDAEALHQVDGIDVGAIGRAEAGHRDAHNAAPRAVEAVESVDADKQGERRVKSAANT